MRRRRSHYGPSPTLPRAGWALLVALLLLPAILLGCGQPQPTLPAAASATPPPPIASTSAPSPSPTPLPPVPTATIAASARPTLPPAATVPPTRSPVAPSPTRAADPQRAIGFGMTTHFMWYDLGRTAGELDQMHAAGLTMARFDVSWSGVEPARKGDYDVAYLLKLDAVLAALDARGIAPIVTVIETPAWARPPGTGPFYPPTNAQDYADVLRVLASRYADRTGMTWEVWNEPNIPEFWQSGVNAAAYTDLLKRTYVAIKAVAPTSTVLGGAIVFNDLKFLRGMYESGAKGFFDGLSLHPYCPGRSPDDRRDPWSMFAAIEDMKAVMTALGDPDKTIWVTEFGWGLELVTEATRAAYLTRAVELVRAWPYVRAFCVYTLAPARGSDGQSFALIDASGAPTASWAAYTAAAHGP